jgi:hypothetical protein
MDHQVAVRRALRYLAFAMTRDGRDSEPKTRLEERLYETEAAAIREALQRVRRWQDSLLLFLDELAQRTGILGPHDGDTADWRFWHRTFKEALAAEQLAEIIKRDGPEGVLAHARKLGGDIGRWAEPYALLAGQVDQPDDLVKTLVHENRPLGLRALATADGLRGDTINEVLELSEDWNERAKVYNRLLDLVDDPQRVLTLVDRIRKRVRNGNDLYHLDVTIREVERRWPDQAQAARDLRLRLYDHIGAPPEALFLEIHTVKDGRVDLWRDIPPGRFTMGSGKNLGRQSEEPPHEVDIVSGFRISAVPITNAQYAVFDPTHWAAKQPDDLARHPVVEVTWYEAVAFCR